MVFRGNARWTPALRRALLLGHGHLKSHHLRRPAVVENGAVPFSPRFRHEEVKVRASLAEARDWRMVA